MAKRKRRLRGRKFPTHGGLACRAFPLGPHLVALAVQGSYHWNTTSATFLEARRYANYILDLCDQQEQGQ